MANKMNSTKVVTGVVRLSYANVWEPASINGSNPKYSVSLIIPKSDKQTLDAINAAVDAAIKEGGYQDVLNQFHCAVLLSQDRKSSSRSVAKSSAAEDLPPRGSPSRTF